jgi:hypothetical protein
MRSVYALNEEDPNRSKLLKKYDYIFEGLLRGWKSNPHRGLGTWSLPLNQVQARGSLDHVANFPWLELESSLLELLLHISLAKESKISPLPSTAAVRLADSKITKRDLTAANASFVAKNNSHSILLRTCDGCLQFVSNIIRLSPLFL